MSGMLGGSSQPQQQQPTSSTVTQTNLPAWAQPYSENLLGQASALTDINQNPYQQYQGQRLADFTPMQQQAFNATSNMQVSPQNQQATNMAGAAGLGSLGAGQQYNQMATNPYATQAFMSPYQQNVTDYQKQQAVMDYNRGAPAAGAAASSAGAFGGSRQAIVESEANRSLQNQLAGIQATGSQNAFQNAQQAMQFGTSAGLQGYNQALQGASTLGQLGQNQYGQQMGINAAQQQAGAQQQAFNQQGLTNQYQDFLNQQNYPYQQLGFMSDILHGTPTGGITSAQTSQAAPNMFGQIAGLGLGIGSALNGVSKFKEGGTVKHFDGGGITSVLADPETEIAAKSKLPPINQATALAKFMLPAINKMHEPVAQPEKTTVAEDMAMKILGRRQQQMAQAQEQQQGMPPQGMPPQGMPPQEPQGPTMTAAEGGLASLPVHNFNPDNYAGGGIIAFADEGEVPKPDGEAPKDEDVKPKRKSRAKAKVDAPAPAPAPATPTAAAAAAPAVGGKTPAQVAAEADAEFRARSGVASGQSAVGGKTPAQVAAEADAEFRARSGVASGQSAETQSRLSKIRNALQPTTLNPNITASGEGILGTLGKAGKFVMKGAAPLTAYDMGKTALDLANTPTDVIRQYYGNNEEPSFLGDVGIRTRAAMGSLNPFGDTAEGLRALQQQKQQTAAPAPAPAPAPQKDSSGLTTDQRAAAFLAGVGGGGGGAGGGGGRAGAGAGGAGSAVANTGLPPELTKLMNERAANLAALKAGIEADKPKGLADYVQQEKDLYKNEGIGKAAEAERARLEERAKRLPEEQKEAFYRNLSQAGFRMAEKASERGATFLGAAAAGGTNFSESNAKTAEHFANLKESFEDKRSKLAQADEAVRIGMISRGSAEHKEAQKNYTSATRDLTKYEGQLNAGDIAALRAIEVAKMQAASELEKTRLQGMNQLRVAQAGQENKNTAEKQLGAAYIAAMKKSPPDTAAAQVILKQIEEYKRATTARDAPAKPLDPMQISTLRAQLKSAINNKDKAGIALYSSLLAPYMPSEAAAEAGAATSGNWSVVK